MSAPRLLVVSPPCHQPVNRAVYAELAAKHGVTLHLVVPQRLHVGGQWRDTPLDPSTQPYELTALELTGTHGRLQRMRGLRELARNWKPTHVLVDSDPASLLVWQAARACDGAAVWALTAENLMPRYAREIVAGIAAAKPRRAFGPLLTWALRKLVHPRVSRVFTLSRDGTRVMEAMGFAGRAVQIPLGFDPSLFHIQRREAIEATREHLGLIEPTVAYFGRLTPEKGVHLLLQALASLKDLRWQLLLDHFSDYESGYSAQLRGIIRTLSLDDRVVFFDAEHARMPDFMNAADIVVLPSMSTPKWKEQYGRVLPEAMACGKAVVGSDSGAIPELVDGHGSIFPEGDVPALADVLSRLLLGGDLGKDSERVAAYASANLSTTRQAEIMLRELTR
jgi:glycosyltransferase involved in cell wall biosynthesis